MSVCVCVCVCVWSVLVDDYPQARSQDLCSLHNKQITHILHVTVIILQYLTVLIVVGMTSLQPGYIASFDSRPKSLMLYVCSYS